jgi:hypothetical protein
MGYHYPSVTLIGLQVTGPDEVAENSQAQYRALAHFDSNSTVDVTDSVEWSVEPNSNCSIDNGLLTTEIVDLPEDVTITAEYGTEIAEKEVSILAICPSGSALEFDGVDDYVEIHDDDSLEGMDELTISMWVKTDSFSNYDCLIHKGTWGEGFVAHIAVGEGIWWGFDVGSGKRVLVRENPTIGKWVFITLWFKGGDEWRIYKDGQLKAHSACVVSTIPTTGTKNIRIGGTYTRTFDGSIDEVSIFNRALSAEEIRMLMHTRPEYTDPTLVGYWNFDEGEGEIAGDSSGNGNNGTVVGAIWTDSIPPVGDICGLDGLVERNLSDILDRKLGILDELAIVLGKEDALLDYMDDAFHNGELDNLNKGDVVKAKQKIHSAIQQEEQAEAAVDQSIDKLDDALNTLGIELISQE